MALTSPPMELAARYNVAPTQVAPVVRADGAGRSLGWLRWGLVPSWAGGVGVGSSMINARAEGIDSKPAFRAAFKRQRCLVPVSGFYEWKKLDAGSRKQPFYITPASDEPLALAGLWDSWRPPEGGAIETFTVITTAPNQLMASLHDRMPAILDPADLATWLDPLLEDRERLLGLLKPYPPELMRARPVSDRVNAPRNDDPTCIALFTPKPPDLSLFLDF